jgi:hypothetical protein
VIQGKSVRTSAIFSRARYDWVGCTALVTNTALDGLTQPEIEA